MDSELAAGLAEYLQTYGIDPQQLALVVAGLSVMLGVRVGARLSVLAWGGAATMASCAFRAAFPQREACQIEEGVLEAVRGRHAAWESALARDKDAPGDGFLKAGGVYAWLEGGKLMVQLCDGTDLAGRLGRKARKEVIAAVKAAKLAHDEAAESLERERIAGAISARADAAKAQCDRDELKMALLRAAAENARRNNGWSGGKPPAGKPN